MDSSWRQDLSGLLYKTRSVGTHWAPTYRPAWNQDPPNPGTAWLRLPRPSGTQAVRPRQMYSLCNMHVSMTDVYMKPWSMIPDPLIHACIHDAYIHDVCIHIWFLILDPEYMLEWRLLSMMRTKRQGDSRSRKCNLWKWLYSTSSKDFVHKFQSLFLLLGIKFVGHDKGCRSTSFKMFSYFSIFCVLT